MMFSTLVPTLLTLSSLSIMRKAMFGQLRCLERESPVFLHGLLALVWMIALVVSSTAQSNWRVFAQLRLGRHHHVARYLPGDRMIVMGGWTGSYGILDGLPTNTTEIVDLTTGVVSQGPSMRDARAEFPSLVLPDGDILVFGGYSNSSTTRSIERLDVQSMTWSLAGTMATGRRQHAADFINADSILIFGGFNNATAEIFNLVTGESARVRDLPSFANQAVSVNPDGRGPSYFGFREGGPNSPRSKVSLRYSLAQDSWLNDLTFDDSPVAPRVTPLASGSVFLAGGALSETPVTTSRFTWTISPAGIVERGPNLMTGRVHQAMGAWGSQKILVTGGMVDGAVLTTECEWVDLATKTTAVAPRLNVDRCLSQMVVAPSKNGRTRAFVVSGLSNGMNTATIEVLEDTVCSSRLVKMALPEMRLVGSAARDGESIRLTSTGKYESGGAYLPERFTVRNGFDLRFSFRLAMGNDNGMVDNGDPGADGVAVVFLPDNPTAVGRSGDGIGYHEIAHGMAVEYDSYLNPAYSDPDGSHVAVQVGDGRQLRAWHTAPYLRALTSKDVPSFKADGSVYYGRVALTGNRLLVYVSTTPLFAKPVIELENFDIQSTLNLDSRGSCFIGFTSSTGMSTEEHSLLSVEIENCQPLVSVNDQSDVRGMHPQMSIIPNPTTSSASVQLALVLTEDASLEIFDLHGCIVLRQIVPAGSVSWSVGALGSLAPGIYTIRLSTRGGVTSSSLVIMH